jgi:hypothetical protein
MLGSNSNSVIRKKELVKKDMTNANPYHIEANPCHLRANAFKKVCQTG